MVLREQRFRFVICDGRRGCLALELGCAPTKDALLKDALLEAHAAAAPIVDAINALAPSSVDVPRIHEERARLDALASQAAQRHVSQLIEFFSGRNLRDDEDPSSKRDRGKAQDRARSLTSSRPSPRN